MDCWLRVDCDYGAEGLWDDRGRMISVAHIPISEALGKRILAWQEWHDEQAEPWSSNDLYDWNLHWRTATDIARCIKRELPDWTVVARDRLILGDGSLGRRIPFPGEHLLTRST